MTESLRTLPPPLAAGPLLVFLLQVALLLVCAVILGRVAELMKMPAIVGELLTGVILGPSLLGVLAPGFSAWILPADPNQAHLLDAVGQLGVLLLVGLTGAHLDHGLLRRRGATALRVSLSGLLIPLGLGIAAGSFMPATMVARGSQRWVFALFLGGGRSIKEKTVIAKTLTDMGLIHRDIGQLTLVAGTVDDVVGWLLLSVLSAAATIGVSAGGVVRSVAYLAAFLAIAFLAGRPLVRGVLRLAARTDGPGPSVVMAVVLILLGAAATDALGLEPVFGAFIMGMLIGARGAVDQYKIAPLRTVTLSVLAPLFMATAGLRMDLTELRHPAIAVAAVVVLSIAVIGKFAGAFLGARLSGLSNWEGLALGAGMNARGVIEVIVATAGLRLGVLTTATYTIVILVAIVTSLMAPPVLRLAMRRVSQNDEESVRHAEHLAWAGQRVGAVTDA